MQPNTKSSDTQAYLQVSQRQATTTRLRLCRSDFELGVCVCVFSQSSPLQMGHLAYYSQLRVDSLVS